MTDSLERITINPVQCGGRPTSAECASASSTFSILAAGLSADQVLGELLDLEIKDLQAVLRYASLRLDHPVLAA
jgi:uncharacterized protein (DUF433 family)